MLKVLFVEPPKDFWFVMGEYIPPPFGVLALAGYLLREDPEIDVEVVDSQSEGLDWARLEARIARAAPDIVAPSGLSTANAFHAIRVCQLAKMINPSICTVVGGQHFTALAEETLRRYPEVDFIVRGEGEVTFTELVDVLKTRRDPISVLGITYRKDTEIIHNSDRVLICDLDTLPSPAYHLVEKHMKGYYFALMAEKETPFAIIEGSRGCSHDCAYCSQSPFWRQTQRVKSPKLIVDEIEHLNRTYGSRFFWFTDDYFSLGYRTEEICRGIKEQALNIQWFCQARCDDIVAHADILPLLRDAGCVWMLVGFDNPSPEVLDSFRRFGVNPDNAKKAVDLLRQNGIFSQGTFIIGHRSDSTESVEALRKYADWLDPDIATFMVLTPFPGTEVYSEAKQNGWIEDKNWANYDMIHAVMPTEHLSRLQVQEELHRCYDDFFGSWPRRYRGIGSKNPFTRRTYLYLAQKAITTGLRNLF
jgi:anaerobic magnesium-protoporphyrin IX monomethyl ester cyclase